MLLRYGLAFVVGLSFTFLLVLQQTNTIHKRWRASFVTSLALSFVGYQQMAFVAKGQVDLFMVFAVGAAIGSAAGNLLGNKWGSKKERT